MNYLQEMFSLEKKTVIITGGGGAIAGAMTEALLKAGAKVVLWDLFPEALEAARDRFKSDRLFGVQVDALDEAAVVKAIEDSEQLADAPDVLINAAGGNRGKGPFTEVDLDSFAFVLKLNLQAGLVIPTKHITKYWISRGIKGSVINLASMASYIPLSGIWAYNAAKAAVKNLTMATAKEFAAHGIRVNAIAPGFFIGKQNKDLLIKDEATGELTERGKSIIDHTPFGRFGKIEELQGVTLFLISDQASGFITGTTIPVDGGYLIDNI